LSVGKFQVPEVPSSKLKTESRAVLELGALELSERGTAEGNLELLELGTWNIPNVVREL
jgi:hypothetical protein